MEYKYLRPSQTLLDPENPRLPDGTSNDREAINRLLAEGSSQMLALARDFASTGEANPGELPFVLKDGSKYIVLEGNRRFAVLKLLADPKLADDAVHQAAYERIKRSGKTPPARVYCAVVESRTDADHWITLRHTGANNGVGVREWSAEQNARHRRRMRAPIDSGTSRAIAIADELTEAYQTDTELVDLISKVRTDKLTNIGRLFSNDVLTRLQLDLRTVAETGQHTLWSRHTADELHAFVTWAFQILATRSVDAFKNRLLREELLNNNASVLPDPADATSTHHRLADRPFSAGSGEDESTTDSGSQTGGSTDSSHTASGSGSSAGGSSSTGDGSGSGSGTSGRSASGGKKDAKPEKFLYSGVRLPNLSASIQRLLREAKAMPIEDYYAAACVLARVILELTVSEPKVLKWSGKKESATLQVKIRACILKLDPMIDSPQNRTRQDLVQASLETNEVGVIYLHQFMHNPMAKSDPHLARRFSAAFTPLLNSINEEIQ